MTAVQERGQILTDDSYWIIIEGGAKKQKPLVCLSVRARASLEEPNRIHVETHNKALENESAYELPYFNNSRCALGTPHRPRWALEKKQGRQSKQIGKICADGRDYMQRLTHHPADGALAKDPLPAWSPTPRAVFLAPLSWP